MLLKYHRSALLGSPPLTRGQHAVTSAINLRLRITPAHAGTTTTAQVFNVVYRDHPRSRGDNATNNTLKRALAGSPPLTRGQQAGRSLVDSEAGITPAHAGTTRGRHSDERGHRDHPRSRGDNFAISSMVMVSIGSPPLTRGQLDRPYAKTAAGRITPAHAGTTRCLLSGDPCKEDHPRSRGDNHSPIPTVKPPAGSPPLTRGQRQSFGKS